MSAFEENESSADQQIENPPDSKPTPAIVKNRRFREHFQSPSDQMMSPFSAQLAGRQSQFSRYPAILKQKPKKLVEGDATEAQKHQPQSKVEPLTEKNKNTAE